MKKNFLERSFFRHTTLFLLNLIFLLAFSIPCFASTIELTLNGKQLVSPIAPIIDNGTTLVPLRLISENLNTTVSYNNEIKTISITSKDTSIHLTLGSTTVKVNEEIISLSIAPRSIKGTTMVPLRFISENLNCTVNWDAKNQLITITSLNASEQPITNTLPIATMMIKDYGSITLELYPDLAPNTVNNFIFLANSEFYDGLTFHRIIDDFMIQGGDPLGTGVGGPGYTIAGEFSSNGFNTNTLSHTKGIISMARSNFPDSGGSQFFITSADATYLDGQYAAFGKVLTGLDVLEALSNISTNANDAPLNPVIIENIRVNTKGIVYSNPVVIMN